jgi:hypothetical protein
MKPVLGNKKSRLYETAIAALLAEPTIAKAAARCGVSVSTMKRWMQDEQFIKLYRDSKALVLDTVKNQLRQLGEKAVATLGDVIDSKGAADSDKINCAKFVVNSLLSFEVTDALTVRLADLERNNSEEIE